MASRYPDFHLSIIITPFVGILIDQNLPSHWSFSLSCPFLSTSRSSSSSCDFSASLPSAIPLPAFLLAVFHLSFCFLCPSPERSLSLPFHIQPTSLSPRCDRLILHISRLCLHILSFFSSFHLPSLHPHLPLNSACSTLQPINNTPHPPTPTLNLSPHSSQFRRNSQQPGILTLDFDFLPDAYQMASVAEYSI